jgi:hypothetical protein
VDAPKRSKHPDAGRVRRAGSRLRKPSALDRLAARVASMSDAQRERLGAYLDKGPPVSEQLRLAIDASGQSRYAICKATGIDQGQLSKFMAGKLGLSIDALDILCAYLGLELRPARRKKQGG